VAVSVWLTQCGLPIACDKSSKVSLFDSVFVRCGSHDDISNDKSSFFVEMEDVCSLTASVQRGQKSLICVDELGRSTTPDDGTALLAALIRYLAADEQKKTNLALLSSHFHLQPLFEDDEAAAVFPKGVVQVGHLEVLNKDDNYVFTHKLKEGFSRESFAFHIAEVAGVAQEIVKDARRIKEKITKKID
jgi:DNA mismatch repair protein MutS